MKFKITKTKIIITLMIVLLAVGGIVTFVLFMRNREVD